ncbi:zinc finger MYM-type protein 1-like [Palaemon carinicauda]|uniref:zinc finger MYM-type protein 1-like n=1 Tax=Palaemon carinicauda TaxID=392227 RepID=UPI0035B5DC7E
MEADDEPNEEDSLNNLEQVAPQEPQTEARTEVPDVEEPFSMLHELQYPNDPTHVVNYKICIRFQSQALDIALETANQEVQAARDKEKQRNREILCRLISITLYLARRGLPFSGDQESSISENRGNVEMFSKYNSVVKLHLDVIKEKQEILERLQVSLLSNRTQNDLIKALAISVRRVILEEIHKSKIFSILIDETSDVSHTEQVSFVVRYVHDFKIKERFIQVLTWT